MPADPAPVPLFEPLKLALEGSLPANWRSWLLLLEPDMPIPEAAVELRAESLPMDPDWELMPEEDDPPRAESLPFIDDWPRDCEPMSDDDELPYEDPCCCCWCCWELWPC